MGGTPKYRKEKNENEHFSPLSNLHLLPYLLYLTYLLAPRVEITVSLFTYLLEITC